MRNIKMILEYDGSKYYGWQRLGKNENTNTVENKLLQVIQKMTGETCELNCACRTELGVHAAGQVVNFKTNCKMSMVEMKNYMNRYLPMDIAILHVEEKPERFHASLNAKKRIYTYRIDISDVPSVFNRKYCYYSFKKPNKELMEEAAKKLVGKHDFRKFSTVKKTKSTEKEIYEINIYQDKQEMQITITANDYLHNMVRMIVSTLLDIGVGVRPVTDTRDILNLNSEIKSSDPIDPKGLILDEVVYEQ